MVVWEWLVCIFGHISFPYLEIGNYGRSMSIWCRGSGSGIETLHDDLLFWKESEKNFALLTLPLPSTLTMEESKFSKKFDLLESVARSELLERELPYLENTQS